MFRSTSMNFCSSESPPARTAAIAGSFAICVASAWTCARTLSIVLQHVGRRVHVRLNGRQQRRRRPDVLVE